MKNILIISAVFPPEPVVSAKISSALAEELAKTNDIIVLTPKPTRPSGFNFTETRLTKDNFRHVQVNSYTCPDSTLFGRIRESYSFGRHCKRFIIQNNKTINLIYANTWPLLAQLLTVRTAQRFKIPVIIHVQDIYPESLTNKLPAFGKLFKFLLLPMDKYILRKATWIITISNHMRSYLVQSRKIDSKKVLVIQNWQDEDAFINFKSTYKNNKQFTFMYLGNIGPVAGVELLIEAYAKSELKSCRLIIAGDGSMKESLQKRIVELNLNTVEFWSVPDGKVPEIQDMADVLLLPIKMGAALSSIPSKLPAYMFSGKPIIACADKNSDTANAILSSGSGWVLPPENIEQLSEIMKTVISLPDKELIKKGECGFNYALQNLSKKKNLQKVVDIFNEVIET
jgi:glycosyltransferase involved in cell wall biosynthesis